MLQKLSQILVFKMYVVLDLCQLSRLVNVCLRTRYLSETAIAKKKSHKVDTAGREKFPQGLINIPVNVQCSLIAAKCFVNCFQTFSSKSFLLGKYRE